MAEVVGPYQIEIDEGLEDGEVIALDAKGNVIGELSGSERPDATHMIRLSPAAFERLWNSVERCADGSDGLHWSRPAVGVS